MANLIIATKDKGSMQLWIDTLSPLHSIVVHENVDMLFTEDSAHYTDALLLIDASFLSDILSLANLCQHVKKVILISDDFSPGQQIRLILDGASGYSNRAISENMIILAIKSVLNNEIWLERHLIPQIIQGVIEKRHSTTPNKPFSLDASASLSVLTQREAEVVEHIYKGKDNQTISETLHISVRTVKAHLTAIFKKLNVQDRFQLVVYLKDLHVNSLS